MHFYRKCWYDLFKEQFISLLNLGQNYFVQLRWNWFSVRLPVTNAWNCHLLYTAFSSNVGAWGMWACSLSFMTSVWPWPLTYMWVAGVILNEFYSQFSSRAVHLCQKLKWFLLVNDQGKGGGGMIWCEIRFLFILNESCKYI